MDISCAVFVCQTTTMGGSWLRLEHCILPSSKYQTPVKFQFAEFIAVDFYRGFIYWSLVTGRSSLVPGNSLLVTRYDKLIGIGYKVSRLGISDV